jgi:hypothetical protein
MYICVDIFVVCMYMCACAYVCACVYVHVCMCMYVCACMCACVCIYVCICTRIMTVWCNWYRSRHLHIPCHWHHPYFNPSISSSTPLSPTLITTLLTSTRTLLLINADHYTAWNIRKQLMISQHITYTHELSLLSLIYTKHPKSGEAWAHRRWVLEKIDTFRKHDTKATTTATTTTPASLYSHPLYQAEILICERTAELYPKNYYAWVHRQYLIQLLTSYHDMTQELICVEKWTNTHISDHCGYHHRQCVIQQILLTTCHAELVNENIEYIALPPALSTSHASHTHDTSHYITSHHIISKIISQIISNHIISHKKHNFSFNDTTVLWHHIASKKAIHNNTLIPQVIYLYPPLMLCHHLNIHIYQKPTMTP